MKPRPKRCRGTDSVSNAMETDESESAAVVGDSVRQRAEELLQQANERIQLLEFEEIYTTKTAPKLTT